MLWLMALAQADDTPLCQAVQAADVEEVRRLVTEGAAASVFCDWAELGQPGRTGGSRGSARSNTRDAVAIVATGGILAPFVAFGRRGGGGSNGKSSVDMAIRSGSVDLLRALNSRGDLDRIQSCLHQELWNGSLAIARRCGESLAKPTLTSIDADGATPARLKLMKELKVTIEPPRLGHILDWGTSWARNPDGIQVLLDLGLPPDDLKGTATHALSWGPLEGLDMLRDRYDVPLEVGEISSRWFESATHRRGVTALEADLSKATVNWRFRDDDLVKRPYVMDAFLEMGLPLSAFDHALTPLLDEGHTTVAKRVLKAGARARVDFRMAELAERSDLRTFILEHDLEVDGRWWRHPWTDADANAVLGDPALLAFTRDAGLSLCRAIEVAAETDRLDALRDQRLANCDEDVLEDLGTDLALIRAAAPETLTTRAASKLASAGLDADRLDILAFAVERADGPISMKNSIRRAFDEGRTETAAAGLAHQSDLDWLLRSHFDGVVAYLPADRFGTLELDEDDRQELFLALLTAKRFDAALGLAGPMDEPRVVMQATLDAPDAPGALILALIDAGADANWPDPMGPALDRADPDLVRGLLERGSYAHTDDVERAFALGFPPDLVAAMINEYTKRGALRRLRKAARDAGWSEADAERLRRPVR